jgi:hypothetical protein
LATAAQIEFAGIAGRTEARDREFELVTACCGFQRPAVNDLLEAPLNWNRVLEIAEHHRLTPALGEEIGAAFAVLRERARLHAWRALHLTAELKRIALHFEKRGIQFLAHKGPALGKLLYGDPAMRQFGDLDVLVSAQNIQRSREALRELGYEPELRLPERQERAFLRAGCEYTFALGPERHLVELQWQIVPRFCAIDFDMDAIFERAIEVKLDGVSMRTPGYEDLMLLLCVHAAKHQWSQLGMLRDIAMLTKQKLDWNWIASEANRLRISKIIRVSLMAAERTFGIRLSPHWFLSYGKSASDIVDQVIAGLRHSASPNTESLSYFRDQLRLRERLRDQMRFVWRLAITPGVEEWRTVKLPEKAFGLYRAIRAARLLRRFALR